MGLLRDGLGHWTHHDDGAGRRAMGAVVAALRAVKFPIWICSASAGGLLFRHLMMKPGLTHSSRCLLLSGQLLGIIETVDSVILPG